MKGILTAMTAALVGAVVIIGTVIIMLLPLLFLKMHVIGIVHRVYEYDNTQSYLLTLLSKTHGDKTVYSQIAENLQTGSPSTDFVKDELDTLIGDRCYRLSYSSEDGYETIVEKGDCVPIKYSFETKIALPYSPGKLTKTLKLVID